MSNLVLGLVIVAILVSASYKIMSDRKRGIKCTGCPYAPKNGQAPKSDCGCH
jgi:hypothetical protein